MRTALCVLPASLAIVAAITVTSCRRPPPDDPLCTTEPLPETARVEAGQGALLVPGASGEYVYLDSEGKSITNGKVATLLAAKPGEYRAKLNGSTHVVYIREKLVTKCASGAVLLSGNTDEYYYLQDVAGTQLTNTRIGHAIDLFPGTYKVTVNGTIADAGIKPGSVVEIKTGLLRVLGSTDEYYYVQSPSGTQLANNKLSAPLSLLPGAVIVKINNSTAPLQITPGANTELQTGALQVQGTTEEYYYVTDATGNQLANSKLNGPLSFVEGDYTVRLNNVKIPVKVEAGKTSQYQTATLTVKGTGDSYYYVTGENGSSLTNSKLNSSVALPEGTYSVRVGNETRPAKLVTGKTLVLNW